MKLRCTHNSIRLRLRKSDLNTLVEKGEVKEQVSFPGGKETFSFILKLKEELDQVHAASSPHELEISLPKFNAISWANSAEVGIEVYQELGGEEQLHLLIEKDFPCLDRENEDKSDTFWELSEEAKSC